MRHILKYYLLILSFLCFTLNVVAQNNSAKNIYIQSATLNGKPYKKSYISYSEIMSGGTLTFVMGDTPNKNFGSSSVDRPKSAE